MRSIFLAGRNEFTILTGLQHQLLGIGLNFDIPAGLLYGGLTVVGHEMIHGFDDYGRFFDKDGLKFNWWRKTRALSLRRRPRSW